MENEGVTTEGIVHHGHNLRKMRNLRGVKQSDIAEQMGVQQSTVCYWETCSKIDDVKLDKLAGILNIDPVILKTMKEEPVMIYVENNTFNLQEGSFNNIAPNHNDAVNRIENAYYSSSEATKKLRKQLKEEQSLNKQLRDELEEIKKQIEGLKGMN